MTTYSYTLYGLALLSNRPLPYLARADNKGTAPLYVNWAGVGPTNAASDFESALYSVPVNPETRDSAFSVWNSSEDAGGGLVVRVSISSGQALFVIDPSGCGVDISWSRGMNLDDIVAYLLGPVIGCVLRLRGTILLHAGGILVNGRAILLIGDKGAGKSTLTAAFAREGFPILTDDLAPLTRDGGSLRVTPGYPCLRLWPACLSDMGLDPAGAPKVLSMTEKRFIKLDCSESAERWRFSDRPCPVGAIYSLEERCASDKTVRTTLCSIMDSLELLVRNGYVGYAMDRRTRDRQFQIFGEISRTLPVRRVSRPDGVNLLPDAIRAIVNDSVNSRC